ncbi:MRG/MORF4L-binding protein isoform X3 [Petromyzon marinus]
MLGHKPVGINRHFHMVCIRDKFSQNIGRQVPSRVIWDHLAAMYDIPALVRAQNDSESLPFPNTERPFCLPDDILHDGRDIKEGKVVEVQEDAPERESSQGPAEDTVAVIPPRPRPAESGSRDPTDKRKRSRAPASTSSSSPASPGGAAPVSKRRRT